MATEPATGHRDRDRRPSSSSTRPRRCSRSRRPKPPGLVPLKTEETSELDKRVAPVRRRAGRARLQQPGVRQEGRSADRDGPQGDRRSGRRVQPLPRPAGQGDRQGHRHRRRPDRASPHRRGARPEGSDQDHASSSGSSRSATGSTAISTNIAARRPTSPKILSSLGNGKDELLMDNAAIDTERANLWKTMHKLEQMIHISKTPRPAARGQGQRARRDRSGQGQGDPRDARCSTRASARPTC